MQKHPPGQRVTHIATGFKPAAQFWGQVIGRRLRQQNFWPAKQTRKQGPPKLQKILYFMPVIAVLYRKRIAKSPALASRIKSHSCARI